MIEISFSQKYGYTSVTSIFQREEVIEEFRISIWNNLKLILWDNYDSHPWDMEINRLVKDVWLNHLNRDLDSLPSFLPSIYRASSESDGAYGILKKYFFTCEWYLVYDFLEFIVKSLPQSVSSSMIVKINFELEKFNAAYRFIDISIVEITDKNEIEAIEVALNHPEKSVREHLNSALNKLSDKEAPDYRNSIKESISAVEAACRILTGNKSATLGDALKKVNNLHPAMKQAFDKLYGYTSDASGVRHSLLDEDTITYADAKFMLVTCSAFVSYLNTNLSKP